MNAKAQHTPGPWGYEDPMGPDILSIVAKPDGEVYEWVHVAQIGTHNESDDDDQRSFEEHEANARLIAAAPELLDALRLMLRHSCVADAHPSDKDYEDHNAERAARAAIAKAGAT